MSGYVKYLDCLTDSLSDVTVVRTSVKGHGSTSELVDRGLLDKPLQELVTTEHLTLTTKSRLVPGIYITREFVIRRHNHSHSNSSTKQQHHNFSHL
jgi:hypothetical protein